LNALHAVHAKALDHQQHMTEPMNLMRWKGWNASGDMKTAYMLSE